MELADTRGPIVFAACVSVTEPAFEDVLHSGPSRGVARASPAETSRRREMCD
jgi:hypothetical protein